jgi:bacteriorhodopsin
VKYIGGAMALELNITDPLIIGEVIALTGSSLLPRILEVPGIDGNVTAYNIIVEAGQLAYAASYKYVYYTSIAFGAISIVAACFLGNIDKYMDDHVAVVMH